MAKKDAAETVLNMLSTTGASTRSTSTPSSHQLGDPAAPQRSGIASAGQDAEQLVPAQKAETSAAAAPERPEPALPTVPAARPAHTPRRRAAAAEQETAARDVPRTLRLRASTAAALRDAWLEAKRDDVLLSHQDFASDLLDAALRRRRSTTR